MEAGDAFVRGILGVPLLHDYNDSSGDQEMTPIVPSAAANSATAKKDSPKNASQKDDGSQKQPQPQQQGKWLIQYGLIFINFTFIIAAVLMIMAGVVVHSSSAVKLCQSCKNLATTSIVLGAMLWFVAMLGFNWIRLRSILYLLAYTCFLVFLVFAVLGMVIVAAFFDTTVVWKPNNDEAFLPVWKQGVQLYNGTTGEISPLCELQKSFNCSGFFYGCCLPYNASAPNATSCYGSPPNMSTPSWVAEVCPSCPDAPQPAPQVCSSEVDQTLRRNFSGFVIIQAFGMFLVLTGMWLAFLMRKFNRYF